MRNQLSGGKSRRKYSGEKIDYKLAGINLYDPKVEHTPCKIRHPHQHSTVKL